MDLKQLSIDPDNQKEEYALLDPRTDRPLTDEDGSEVTLTLWGPDSTVLKQVEDKYRKKSQSKAMKKGNIDFFSVGRELSFEKTVAAVADWKNIGYEGEELECTPENVRKIFKTAPWIQEQVSVFISDRANFMNG